MTSDIGLGLEKWLATYKPFEWINEDLRHAVVKSMANEWKWGKNDEDNNKDWTMILDTEEVEEVAEDVWRTKYEEEPVVSDSLLVKELKEINNY